MQGFVTKPIRLEPLAAAIAAVTGAGAAAVARPGQAVPPAEVLDAAHVASLTQRLTPATWAGLLRDFEDQARTAVAGLVLAAQRGVPHREVTHGMKGVAWNFGAKRLGDLLHALEHLGPAELRQRLPELQHATDATLLALRRVEVAR